ncbi:MAG: glycoside hydrolase family 2 TIM barrel-domain containing protein, partial [Phycisphaerae bacterium]
MPAGAEKTVEMTADWKDPKLWWPDDPQLYWVVTKVSVDGKVVDVERTRFGFREWTWDSHLFRLNGVKWQLWADCDYGGDPKAWVAKSRKSGMNMIRYWRRDGWGGMTRRQVLDYMDEQGVPVRDSGIFDGEHALYGLTEGGREDTRAKKALFDNWIHQMAAWVRAERNHPSVFIWSIENEIAYINSWNLGRARWAEPEIRRGAEAVMKLDPTRPAMVDGGRCLLDGSLPVNGAHYNDTSGVAQRDYPDAAYTREHWYRVKHRGAWEMIPNRPIFHGECFFANGYTPGEFAGLGGDRCFIGMSETHAARGLYAKMLSEGWRWCEVAAWHMWFGSADRQYYNAWQPVCVFCRQWNWTFAGGSTVPRTLKVFNSTRHADPIELGWRLTAGGKLVARENKTLRIPPGETEVVNVSLPAPAVTERTAGELVLTCSRGGKEVFREVKPLWIIDPDAAPKPKIAPGDLTVLDPHGAVKARLARRGIPFTEVKSVDEIARPVKLLIVGADAVPEDKAADPMWHALAAGGTKMLVLDQVHPLHYQAVPADLDVTGHTGRVAFSEDLSHPVFAGLAQADFFTWSDDHVVYRNAYKKASTGARSLVQCDRELNYTALSQCQVRDGLMMLCQLAVGRKLGTDPVARRLFDNMVNYLAAYAPVRKDTAVVVDAAAPAGKLLRSIGLKHDDVADPVAAISGGHGIAVIDATPANLKKLAAAGDKVRAFTSKGGWIMLWGVTPEGLADYNLIVGHQHVIRPFRMERVVLSAPRDPLTSGLTLRDVVMESSERIAQWMAVRWAADDAFTCVLDYDEVGPFLKLPTPAEMGKPDDVAQPKRDHWPPNMFNGFTADDYWRYCFSIILDRGDKTKWTMVLPRPEEIVNFSIVLNVIYHKVTRINLYFDDDPSPFTILTRPTHDRQDFAVDGRKAGRITIELAEWEKSGR